MSADTVTHWTCDRCGLKRDLVERGQPDNWCQIRVTSPPLASPVDGEAEVSGHICGPCVRDLIVFMRGCDG